MDWIATPEGWLALVTLTLLELVLGIDNIVFISILSAKLGERRGATARRVGLILAMGMRIALLFSISWVIQLTAPLFEVFANEISGRDLIMIGGGLFLLAKATHEIHQKLEGEEHEVSRAESVSFGSVIMQIVLLDAVFSLDSVITAVGMVDEIAIMVIAVVVSVGFMLVFADPISAFVERHPTVKMLALSFLLLIGMALVADGFEQHIPRGYIYFAMGFSVFVETLNLRLRKVPREPVRFRERYLQRGA